MNRGVEGGVADDAQAPRADCRLVHHSLPRREKKRTGKNGGEFLTRANGREGGQDNDKKETAEEMGITRDRSSAGADDAVDNGYATEVDSRRGATRRRSVLRAEGRTFTLRARAVSRHESFAPWRATRE
ncbi:hypothetical protein MRX96_014898 [Rhipicephalus microplus]